MSGIPTSTTTLVGRARERGELSRLAAAPRLLTLLGPGGVGKTRLAAEAALSWAGRFPDGVYWLDVSALRDPEILLPVVADHLAVHVGPGTDFVDSLAASLVERQVLLVLDNCEHLVDACASLASILLARCPSVRVLATSRESLAVAGEVVYPVPTLPPEEALLLFVQRAQARRPNFEAIGRARSDVVTLCRRLDHLPLAIELAAARIGMMAPGEMLDHLDRRFELLASTSRDTSERHRSLLATVEWSYRLLDSADRRLLDRLAVCAGSFDLATAEALMGSVALGGIGRLVDRSLVLAQPSGGGTRYRLLEAIRDYGLGRLAEAGGLHQARDRHLAHFLAAVEVAYAERMTAGSDRLLLMLDSEVDNLRAALEHAYESDPARGLRLAGAMREQWVRRNPAEGRRWLQRLLPHYGQHDAYLGRALLAIGHIAMVRQANAEAGAAFERSRDVCAEAGDAAGEAWAVFYRGAMETLNTNDRVPARHHLEQALELHSMIQCDYGVLQTRATMGQLLIISGERLDEGRGLLEDVLARAEELGNRWSAGHAHTFLGLLDLRSGEWAAAGRHFRAAVHAFDIVNDQVLLAAALCGLARTAVRTDARRGARLAAAADEVRRRVGSRFAGVWAGLLEETRTEAATAIGRSAAEQAWELGRRLTIEEAIEAAGGRARAGRAPSGLSRRELEVAELVARGLSNRATAQCLHLSERTVEGHVLHILNKLALSNRTQVAGWLHGESGTESSTG